MIKLRKLKQMDFEIQFNYIHAYHDSNNCFFLNIVIDWLYLKVISFTVEELVKLLLN